jgi:hypothetical protein
MILIRTLKGLLKSGTGWGLYKLGYYCLYKDGYMILGSSWRGTRVENERICIYGKSPNIRVSIGCWAWFDEELVIWLIHCTSCCMSSLIPLFVC